MAKRFTSDGSLIRLFGFPLVERQTTKDAKKRVDAANEKFASVSDEALCVKFCVPFTSLQKWLQNKS